MSHRHFVKHVLALGALLLAAALPWLACARRDTPRKSTATERALASLNQAMANAARLQEPRAELLRSLTDSLTSSHSERVRWESAARLASLYRQLNADTAMKYASRAVNNLPHGATGLDSLRARLAYVNAQSTAGLFLSAHMALDSIKPSVRTQEEKIEYWKTMRMHCSYMLAYLLDNDQSADDHRARYRECDDSLLANLPADDVFRRFIMAEKLVDRGRWREAQGQLEGLLAELPVESNLYGMTAYQLAETAKHRGDLEGYTVNLAKAAESDIRGSVREGLALPALANWLYDHGDLEDAFNYINYALQEANNASIRMRTVYIASLMPVIDQAYRAEIDSSRKMLRGFLIGTAVLLLLAVVLMFMLMKAMRRMREDRRKIAADSRTLTAYVGNFIGLCSTYANRLEQLSKLVTRKIAAGQADDLVKTIASGKFAQNDSEEFYRLIDKALLDIFPDLVAEVNSLLEPDGAIILREGESLTPELRICAFVRLGVEQSSKIAQILNYSVNTVYSYRNRIRNRAVNRDTFDADLLKLGGNLEEIPSFISE